MATQSSMGHGMRRRNGAPSNNYQEAGPSMARMHSTSDEHHAAAGAAGSHRIAVGADSTYAAAPAPVLEGTLVPRKNTQAGDPTNPGSKANRTNTEYLGASYRVQPKSTFVQLDPAAGPTMASARLLPSLAGNTDNFGSGVQASSL